MYYSYTYEHILLPLFSLRTPSQIYTWCYKIWETCDFLISINLRCKTSTWCYKIWETHDFLRSINLRVYASTDRHLLPAGLTGGQSPLLPWVWSMRLHYLLLPWRLLSWISYWCIPLLHRHLQAALSLVWLRPSLRSGTLAGTIWVREMETCCRKRWSRTASCAWFSSTSRAEAGMLLRLGHHFMSSSFLVLPLGFSCCF